MRLDAAKPRIQIDPNRARELGIRYCAERNTRQLSPQDVADKLLFSKQQVLGLETGDLKSFYGIKLFLQAADKYAALLDIAERPSEYLVASETPSLPEPLHSAPTETPTKTQATAKSQPDTHIGTQADTDSVTTSINAPERVALQPHDGDRKRSPAKPLLLFLAAVALSALGFVLMNTSNDTQPSATPTTPVAAQNKSETATAETAPAATAPAPTAAEPVATVAAAAPGTAQANPSASQNQATTGAIKPGQIQLKFSASSWVQVVATNGNKQEKVYQSGDTLNLEPQDLQALIIGNAKGVTLTGADGDISLASYVASGSHVARIIGPSIRQLAKGK